MKVCPNCAASNGDAAGVCAMCGTLLAPPGVPVTASRSGLPPPVGFAPPQPQVRVPDADANGSLAAVIEIAERSGRADLAARLRSSRDRIRRTGVTVAVVGEFKQGKSSLVNAIVNADICPADPVDATVTPIFCAHGDTLTVTVTGRDGGATSGDLDRLRLAGSEEGNPANHLGVRRIDVTLPRRVLASGLTVVDTPGVGGLESAAGALNLAALDDADGALFVSDCGEELTAPEIAYLAAAFRRCPAVVCVMTKVDLFAAATAVAGANRRHLDAAGLADVELVMVSSALHVTALARSDPALEQESGFAQLFDVLHRRIWAPARTQGLSDAGRDVTDVAGLLALPIDVAARARASDRAAEQTIQELRQFHGQVVQFRSPAAAWQARLTAELQRASVELGDELRARTGALEEAIHHRVEDEAPTDELQFEAWLNKVTVEAVVGHYRLIAERAEVVVADVAAAFAELDRHEAFTADTALPTTLLGAVHIEREPQRLMKDGVARRLVKTGRGYSGGVVLVSSVVGVISAIPWIPLVALPLAGLLAKRAFSDDRERRHAIHRDELERLGRQYVEEVVALVHDDAQRTLQRIDGEIRRHYLTRAGELDVTLRQAIAAAERLSESDDADPSADRATIRDAMTVASRLVTAGGS